MKTTSRPAAVPADLAFLTRCLELVRDKKAVRPIALDLREISTIADYLVICSAQSEPQLKAIASGLEKGLKDELGRAPLAVDGFPASQWIVLDYGDVMVHILHEQRRTFYALEDLWSDAAVIEVADEPAAVSSAAL